MRSSVRCSLLILFVLFAAVTSEEKKSSKCVGLERDPPEKKKGSCSSPFTCTFLRGSDDCFKEGACDCQKGYVRGYNGNCVTEDACVDDYKKHIQLLDKYKQERKMNRTYKYKKPTVDTEHVLCYDDLQCFDRHTISNVVPSTVEEIDAHVAIWAKRKVFNDYSEKGGRVQMYPMPNNFIPNQFISRLVVMTHGFKQNGAEEQYKEIRDLFLENNIDLVLMIHWGDLLGLDYPGAASKSEVVGRMLGLILARWTKEFVITEKSIHLWGFSLGAQISNFAAKFYTSIAYKKIRRLTLMDAAGPYFDNSVLRPTPDAAHFVEAYHTSGGHFITPYDTITTYKFGIAEPMGHTDFYINSGVLHDGQVQPGCPKYWPDPPCSHSSAYRFFKSSFKCTAVSVHCDSYVGYTKNQGCTFSDYSILGLKSETVIGGWRNQYIDTNSRDICDITEHHKKMVMQTTLRVHPYKREKSDNTCIKLIG